MLRRVDRAAVHGLVASQGVERPYRILVRMPEANRLALGRLLDCIFAPADPPEVQAWRLINQNLCGLQARTHRLHETLSPFARNNTWWEIVTRTARRLGLRCAPGMKDEEVERLLFEHLATEFVRRHVRSDDDPERFLAELHPNLGRAIASLGLSRTGTHMLVAAMLRAAASTRSTDQARQRDPREGHNRLGDWLRRTMPWTWTTSICTGLRLLQQRLGDVLEELSRRTERSVVVNNYGKVGAALVVIHLHDVVERTLEQFDVVGT